jgi:hypothetical protein
MLRNSFLTSFLISKYSLRLQRRQKKILDNAGAGVSYWENMLQSDGQWKI